MKLQVQKAPPKKKGICTICGKKRFLVSCDYPHPLDKGDLDSINWVCAKCDKSKLEKLSRSTKKAKEKKRKWRM